MVGKVRKVIERDICYRDELIGAEVSMHKLASNEKDSRFAACTLLDKGILLR